MIKKKCLSIIAGLFLSVGLGVSKEATQRTENAKQNINANSMFCTNGPIIPEPRASVPVTF
ncbi:hypothetical protein LGL55_18500 [Clostridium tagluense]|uniref:hypothetical protein n=1 Tax=Clostridium tagluense TaxID=360422 RepID=UPI001CF58261|nr:hypothetical protein [Clostridium tagluense]MCB2313234.1 hypothetical protein [Clostridium tagluense]MCB2318015.1 hypothetical protein [Clostridium tagluense]MCB2322788.1 hypothetical protein [Clostridium tagluense]MCB2327799.1 hypothetical protein [Clostridium tagluense]MCB2332446.1 hypothetical protein [Clostridium tagluense]